MCRVRSVMDFVPVLCCVSGCDAEHASSKLSSAAYHEGLESNTSLQLYRKYAKSWIRKDTNAAL